MGRVTRAKAAEMRSQEEPRMTIDMNDSSNPHETNAGVGQCDLPIQDVKTREDEVPEVTTTGIGEPVQRVATPGFDAMPNTMQRVDSPTRVPTRGRDSLERKEPAESMMATIESPMVPSTYDKLEAAAIQVQTPPKASSTWDVDDPITALDEMDEAVEMINAQLPEVQLSPQKPRSKKAPVVRTTKASQARVSLAHSPKDPQRRTSSWGKPPAQTAGSRVTSTSSMKSNDENAPRKEVEIPHSKPRPISMCFPAPPPPPKSTKAPTTSNFQLPGEAIAAKLKAAKEARLQKEAEAQKKKVFKARPAPSMTKAPIVRQTSASNARVSMMNGKPNPPSNSLGRANSVAGTRPSTASSGPQSAKPAATSTIGAPSNNPPATLAPPVSSRNRPATAMASLTNNKARPASIMLISEKKPGASTSSKPSIRPVSQANGSISKGKEVFSRPLQAKAAADQEKRQKEEAAKRARAEAAERTRQQSREWAEKQRLKKLGMKVASERSKENLAPLPSAAEEEEEQQRQVGPSMQAENPARETVRAVPSQ